MKKNEIKNFFKICSVNLQFRNDSIQASLSKDFSLFNKKDENQSPSKRNENINNASYLNNIDIYFNHQNSSSSSARDQSIDALKDKMFSAGAHTGNNFKIPLKNKIAFRTLKYQPKRLINYSNLKSDPKFNKIMYSKAFMIRQNENFAKQKLNKKIKNRAKSTNYLLPSPHNLINLDFVNKENTINNKNIINFKTNQITLFSKASNNYNNYKKYLSFISEKTRDNLNSILSQLVNIVELQRNILFIENNDYNFSSTFQNDNNNLINNKTTINLGSKNDKYLFNNRIMFKFLNINSEYNSVLNKCFELVFNELKEIKEKNMELQKTNYETEILLNTKNKELKEINKYLNSSQTKALILNSKSKEKIIKDLNLKFNKKESKYVLDMYKLNADMKDLLSLLERNKDYYKKYKEIEKNQKSNMNEVRSIKNHLNYELEKKNAQFRNELETNEELNDQIYKLEENINELKNKNDSMKLHEIEINAQVKKLHMVINERNENINMLNEELNYFYIKYNKEFKQHENTKLLFKQFRDKYEIKNHF